MDFQFYTPLTIGLLGSFHCIGMCGPIVLLLSVRPSSFSHKILNGFVYNAGRITTYMLLGTIFGVFGKGIALATSQQFISILSGAMLIIMTFFFNKSNTLFASHFFNQLKTYMITLLRKPLKTPSDSHANPDYLRQHPPILTLFLTGIINGLLPCGLVYVAIAGAVSVGNTLQGILFMLFFGIGTLPAMLLTTVAKEIIPVKVRNKVKKIIPLLLILLGSLFILRGLNLDIPYISPKIEHNTVSPCNH